METFAIFCTVFFFGKRLRRAPERVTDVELTELRYAGKPARFHAPFSPAPISDLIVHVHHHGLGHLGMSKGLRTLGISKWYALIVRDC